jgi:hypothetical protein
MQQGRVADVAAITGRRRGNWRETSRGTINPQVALGESTVGGRGRRTRFGHTEKKENERSNGEDVEVQRAVLFRTSYHPYPVW